ncbi:MAG TPA: hypothetical protein VFE50_23295 [Cyclobacteriaceae bacterium]|nr:hypothetical protein [Cyclobacteriaceae bacterium]
MKSLLPCIGVCVLLISCNPEKAEEICVPQSLQVASDSISFTYTDTRQLTALQYFYNRNSRVNKRIDLTYNNGNLVTVTQTTLAFVTSPRLDVTFNLEYGSDGLPSKLTELKTFAPNEKYVTEFTHDSNKRLVKAVRHVEGPAFDAPRHVGGYIYEYNGNGNVVKIKYLLPGSLGEIVEVVARENITFDDRPVFYANSKDLAILNVYIYNYVPNVNNILTSKILWPSFDSFYSKPEDFSYTPTYDEKGRIQSNSHTALAVAVFGELNFSLVTYACF